jgi:hypothetical protein
MAKRIKKEMIYKALDRKLKNWATRIPQMIGGERKYSSVWYTRRVTVKWHEYNPIRKTSWATVCVNEYK